MSTLYIDVSHHDWSRRGGQLDWAKVRAATSSVMCARATYGDPAGYSPATRHFADFVRAAKAAGVDCCGGYHNLIRGDQASINRQVDWLRRELDRVGAVWAMLDVERYPELASNGLWPRFDDVRQFVGRWGAVDQRVLTGYLPRWIWDGYLGRPDLRVLGCPLVASNYGSNPNGTPAQAYATRGGDNGVGWSAYGGVVPAIWQFGSNVDCPGASGQTDCNAYRGSEAQLRTLLTGQPTEDGLMALSDTDATALIWRVEGLVTGRTAVAGGPTKGEVIVINQRIVALATALGQVDEAVAAQLKPAFAAVTAEVDEVAAETVAGLAEAPAEEAAATICAAVGAQRARALAEAILAAG